MVDVDGITRAIGGVATFGAGWGFGAAGELVTAGAVEVFATLADLGGRVGLGV